MAFYDARVPADVTSSTLFDKWWRRAAGETPDLLHLTEATLLEGTGIDLRAEDFPDRWPVDGVDDGLAVTYRYAPGAADDGVSIEVPLTLLNRSSAVTFSWNVPGFRQELVEELLRALPKPVRRLIVPVPDRAAEFLRLRGPTDGPLLGARPFRHGRDSGARHHGDLVRDVVAAAPAPDVSDHRSGTRCRVRQGPLAPGRQAGTPDSRPRSPARPRTSNAMVSPAGRSARSPAASSPPVVARP